MEILPLDGENPQHVGVLNAFAAHILHGTPLVADGAEGIRALMLSNAMHLSSWTGKPVSLPIDEGEFARLLAENACIQGKAGERGHFRDGSQRDGKGGRIIGYRQHRTTRQRVGREFLRAGTYACPFLRRSFFGMAVELLEKWK